MGVTSSSVYTNSWKRDPTTASLAKEPKQVIGEFFKATHFPQLIYCACQWAGRLGSASEEVRHVGVFTGNVKAFMNAAEGVTRFNELVEAVKGLWATISSQRGSGPRSKPGDRCSQMRSVAKKTASLCGSVFEGFRLVHRLTPLKCMKRIEMWSPVVTLCGGALGLFDDAISFKNAGTDQQRRAYHGMSVGIDLCAVFLGLGGIIAHTTGMVFSLGLPLFTTLTLLNIAQFFFKNMVDPFQENPNPKELLRGFKDEHPGVVTSS